MTDKKTPDMVDSFGLKGRRVRVRSKFSGREGVAFADDPHVFVDGVGMTGWCRVGTLAKHFIVLDENRKEPEQKGCKELLEVGLNEILEWLTQSDCDYGGACVSGDIQRRLKALLKAAK